MPNEPNRLTDIVELRVDLLRPAPWNYKPPGTPEQMAKLVESIKRDGSAGVLAVRQIIERKQVFDVIPPSEMYLKPEERRHPKYADHRVYEVIDGNHRLAAIQEAGWNTVFCEDFGEISLASAITIARRRNEQWYEADQAAYARIFAQEVVPEISLAELVDFMPETMVELENIFAEGSQFFGYNQAPEPDYAPPVTQSGFVNFQVSMSIEAWQVYQQIHKALEKTLADEGTPLHPHFPIAHGQVLELLAADATMGKMGGLLE